MRLQDHYQHLKKKLDALDVRLLMCHALSLTHEAFIFQSDRVLSDTEIAAIDGLIAQRLQGMPVAKIVGEKEFYGRAFITTRDTLDPRPDSETLIDAVLRDWPQNEARAVLELGVGTGCLIITLLAERAHAKGVGVDISPAALQVAQKNTVQHNVDTRLVLLQSNWTEKVDQQFDIIISNPPYIPSGDIAGLARDVRDYDPHLALDGGADGLGPYRAIIADVPRLLRPGGMIAFEVGRDQAQDIAALLEQANFADIRVEKDLNAIARVVMARRF